MTYCFPSEKGRRFCFVFHIFMAYMQQLFEIFSPIIWESVYQYLELLGLHTDIDDELFQNMTTKDDSKILFRIYLLVPFETQWRFLKKNSVCILFRLSCFKDDGESFKTFGHGENEILAYSNFKPILNCSSKLPDSFPIKGSTLNFISMQSNHMIYYAETHSTFPERSHGDATDEENETSSESQSEANMNASSLDVAEMNIMKDISEDASSIRNSSNFVKTCKNQATSYQQDEISSNARSFQCSLERKMNTKVDVKLSTPNSIRKNPATEKETLEVSSKPVSDNFLVKDYQNGFSSLLERRVSAVANELLKFYHFCTCEEIRNLTSRLNNFQPHLKEVKYTELISAHLEVIEECLKNYSSFFSDTNQSDKTTQHVHPLSFYNSSNSDEMLDENNSHTSVRELQFTFIQILEDIIKEMRNSMPSAKGKVFKESEVERTVNADSVEMNALKEGILDGNVTDHVILPVFTDKSQIRPNKQGEISAGRKRSFQSNFKRKRDYELSPIKKHLSFESSEFLEMKSTSTQMPESLAVGTQTDIHSETIMAKDSFSEENPIRRNFLETRISVILDKFLNISHCPSICPPDQIQHVVSTLVEIQNDLIPRFVKFDLENNNLIEAILGMFENIEQCLNELSNIILRIGQIDKTEQQRLFLICYLKNQPVTLTETNYYYDPNDDPRITLVRILNTTLGYVMSFRSRGEYLLKTLTSLSISESENSVVNNVTESESLNVDDSDKYISKKFKSLWQEEFSSENKEKDLTTQECDSTSDSNAEECHSLGYPRGKENILADDECESSSVPTKVNDSAIPVTSPQSPQSIVDNTYADRVQSSQPANYGNIRSYSKKLQSGSSVSSVVDSRCASSSEVHFRDYSYRLYPGPIADPEKVKKDHRFQKKFYKQSRESKENIGKKIIEGKQNDQPEFVSPTLPLREHFENTRSFDKECDPNPSNFTTFNILGAPSSKDSSYTLYPGPVVDPEKVKKDNRFQKKFYKQCRESKENVGKKIIKGKQNDQPEFVSRTLPVREHFENTRSFDKECDPNASNFTTFNILGAPSSKDSSYTLYPGPVVDPEKVKKDNRFQKKFYKQSRESKENIRKKIIKGKQNDQPEFVSRTLRLRENFESIKISDKECDRKPSNFTTFDIRCVSSSKQTFSQLDYKPCPSLAPDLTKVVKYSRWPKTLYGQKRKFEEENLSASNCSEFSDLPNSTSVPQLPMASKSDNLVNSTNFFSSSEACLITEYNLDKSTPGSCKINSKTEISPKNETYTADECTTLQTQSVDESSVISLRTCYLATVCPLSHKYRTQNLNVLFCRNSSGNNLGISYNNRIPLRPALKVINYDMEMFQEETSAEEFLATSRNLVEVCKGMTDEDGFLYTLKVPVIPIKDESNCIPKRTLNTNDSR